MTLNYKGEKTVKLIERALNPQTMELWLLGRKKMLEWGNKILSNINL